MTGSVAVPHDTGRTDPLARLARTSGSAESPGFHPANLFIAPLSARCFDELNRRARLGVARSDAGVLAEFGGLIIACLAVSASPFRCRDWRARRSRLFRAFRRPVAGVIRGISRRDHEAWACLRMFGAGAT